MSDFIFARKPSNLILLYSAKALKADRASTSDTHSTGCKGNYCRKTHYMRTRTCSNIRICLFWLFPWCKKTASVSAFGNI